MFKKKEKTEKAPKNKKVHTMKVGTHKKSVLLLWAVLLASTSFGVYKNFTAIDTHTAVITSEYNMECVKTWLERNTPIAEKTEF